MTGLDAPLPLPTTTCPARLPGADGAAEADPRVRVRNPWGQGDRLRGEILAAAGRLLGELGGAEGLTLRGVAKRAGIAPASIYAHFADKTSLVEAVAAHEYARLVAVLQAASGADPVAALRAKLHAFGRYSMDNPGLYRLLFGRSSRPQEGRAGTLLEVLAAALGACERAGHRLRLPVDRATIVLAVGTHGRVAIQQLRGEADRVDDVFAFTDELISLVFEDCLD